MVHIKLKIPFYTSFATPGHPNGVHCQETSLKMILGYFEPEKNYTIEELEKITDKQPEKGSWEMSFLTWFANNGYEVKHFATFDYTAFKKDGIEYIRETYGNETAEWQLTNSNVEKARNEVDDYLKKVEVVSKKPQISDIIEAMEAGYLVRASVNSNLLNNKEGYEAHSVVVVACDDTSIWFHDPGLPALENRESSHAKFQEAMDSFGSEMDIFKKVQ